MLRPSLREGDGGDVFFVCLFFDSLRSLNLKTRIPMALHVPFPEAIFEGGFQQGL